MPVEQHLLFAVLAFERELLDLQQLTSAVRAWSSDKSGTLADLLVERGWVTAEERSSLEKQAERKLAKHQNDPRVTLNAATRGDVCDALRNDVDDNDVQQSLSSWPSGAPVLIETIEQTQDESKRPKSRYTWVSEVGAGGLGKVWLARDNDLSREVALKEIKPGSASSEAVRRLIKEAQITGQLQHPGIVPVYEVNRDEGRPFYTMKLVRGDTLSKAIREHHATKQAGAEDPLSERRLLNIFLSICDAIAYAHSRGVIHRDLKPQNVVLGEYGEALVLDWGLARSVGSEDEDSAPIVVTDDGQTEATQAGQKLGTPAYMSPEQAAGRVQHMDERTDIYGLGAILFEILTGQAPHQSDESDDVASGLTAMLHRIANGETPRVRAIDATIPDELETICATAMARHRDERYQAAKDLSEAVLKFQIHEESIELASRAADDLEAARKSGTYDDFSRARFGFETSLEQWPDNVRAAAGLNETRQDYAQAAFDRGDFDLALSLLDEADPDQASLATAIQTAATGRASATGRIRRLRRFGFAATVTIAVLAIIAAVWVNFERERALSAQADEATQRGIAERNAHEAQQQRRAAVSAGKLAQSKAEEASVARDRADRNAKEAYDQTQLAEAATETARAQTSVALGTLNTVIFDIQRGLDNVPGAGALRRKLLNTALNRLQQIADKFADSDSVDRQTMVALNELAAVLLRVGMGEAGWTFNRLGEASDGQKPNPIGSSAVGVAHTLSQRALEIARHLAAADPTDVQAQHDLSIGYRRLGDVSWQAGYVQEALGSYEQSLDVAKKVAAADPTDALVQRGLASSYQRLGAVSFRAGHVHRALGFHRQSLDISKKLAAAEPADATAQRDLSVSYNNLGDVSLKLGRADEALGFYQQSMDIRRKLAVADPADALAQRDLATSYEKLGHVSLQTSEARDFYLQSLDILKKLAAADPTDVLAQRAVAGSYFNLGEVSLELGRGDEALDFHQQSMDIRRKLAVADPADALAQRDLATSYERLGNVSLQTSEARDFYLQSLAIWNKLAAADSTDVQAQRGVAGLYYNLGNANLQLGQLQAAHDFYQQALDVRKKLADASPADAQEKHNLSVSYEKLGNANLQLGQLHAARDFYQQVLNVSKKLADADPADTRAQRGVAGSYLNLGNANLQLGQLHAARDYYQQALDVRKKLADASPADAQAQRNLWVPYQKLGDMSLWTGQVQPALEFYRQSFDIAQRLVTVDPADAQAHQLLIKSHGNLGMAHRANADYAASVASFQSALKVATTVHGRGWLKGTIESLIESLRRDVAKSQLQHLVTGDWDTFLEKAEKTPALLYYRVAELAKHQRIDEAAQAAGYLRVFSVDAAEAEAAMLYDAARGYGLCAAAVKSAKGEELTEGQQSRRREFLDLSLVCLKEAFAAGYDDVERAQKDPDLAALRDLPEFQKLVKSPPDDAN